MNPFHHVDLRVRKFEEVQPFYRAFLPLLGFTQEWAGKEFRGFSAEDDALACACFGFTEDSNHQPNGNRIAFWADSRELVDRVGTVIRAAGARNIVQQLVRNTAATTTPSFSRIRTETVRSGASDGLSPWGGCRTSCPAPV
jgi:hypothetical protein